MLELDKSGNWWLDGEIIEPWEITEKWTEMINVCEDMADKGEIQTELLKRCIEVVDELEFGANHMMAAIQRFSERLDCPNYLIHTVLVYEKKNKARALLPDLRKAVGDEGKP